MRSKQILALLCAAPLLLTWLGCSNRALRVSRATAPTGVESSSYTSRMMQLAERYEKQGNQEGALRLYRQIAAADPGQSAVQERIASITGNAGRPPVATAEREIANVSRSAPQITEISRPAEDRPRSVAEHHVTDEVRAIDPQTPSLAESDAESPLPGGMRHTGEPTTPESVTAVEEDPAFAEWIRRSEQGTTDSATEATLPEGPEPGTPAWWADASAGTTTEATEAAPAWASAAARDESPSNPAWNRTSLVRLCPDADEELQSVISHLEEPDDEARKEALVFLASLGNEGTPALPAVDAVLDDPDELVQAHAAWTIWSVGQPGDRSVTRLAALTESDRDDVVQLAAFFLGCIGADAREAETVLRRMRDESTGATRLHLAEALVRINPDDLVSLNELARGLQEDDPALRWLAAVALTGVSPKQAPWVVPALTARLEDSEPSVCSAAALTLGSLGPAAQTAVGPLAKATTHETPDVRLAAEAALACIQH